MSNNVQKSIATTLGLAIAATGLGVSLSSNAQNSTPGTMTTPTTTTTPSSGTMSPGGGAMTKPTGTTAPATTTTTTGKTIVDVAASNKSFKTLVKALKAADLVDTLSGVGPYTVFAPTDEAFNKLPKGALTKLLKPENKAQLQKVLTYHVVAGEVTSKMLKAGKVATVAGADVTVKISGKNVTINTAKVIKADIKTSNGVIHVIDTVLLPPA